MKILKKTLFLLLFVTPIMLISCNEQIITPSEESSNTEGDGNDREDIKLTTDN